MKKITVVIMLIILCVSGTIAREKNDFKKHELRLGYGSPSFYWLSNEIGEAIFSAFNPFAGNIDASNTIFIGPISASYEYHINPLFSFGAVAAYETVMTKGSILNRSDNKTVIGHFEKNIQFISLMAKAQVQYGWKVVKLYHAVYLGGMILIENSNETLIGGTGPTAFSYMGPIFNFHVTAIGVKIGSPNTQFFIDAGFGSLGMVNAGVVFTF